MFVKCQDKIVQDDYTQTPPNIPEYATIISINTNKNKDQTYRTQATLACRSRTPSAEKGKETLDFVCRKLIKIFKGIEDMPLTYISNRTDY